LQLIFAVAAPNGAIVEFGQAVAYHTTAVRPNAVVGPAKFVGITTALDDVREQKVTRLYVVPIAIKPYVARQAEQVTYVPLRPVAAVVTVVNPEQPAQPATPYGVVAVPEPAVVQATHAVPARTYPHVHTVHEATPDVNVHVEHPVPHDEQIPDVAVPLTAYPEAHVKQYVVLLHHVQPAEQAVHVEDKAPLKRKPELH